MARILIVDDSAVVRTLMRRELEKRGLQVIGAASNPYRARDLIVFEKPDAITLDLEMPRMDGLTFLDRLMRHFPLPTVVFSSLTPANSENALQAYELGAVEVFEKPTGSGIDRDKLFDRIAAVLREVAGRSVRRQQRLAARVEVQPVIKHTTDKVAVIGASTGGTQAIQSLLKQLPRECPGLVIVQHMPPNFTAGFASRLDQECALQVKEAVDGEWVTPGKALIAPGNHHVVLKRSGARYVVHFQEGPPVHHMRPSVEVLFNSAAKSAGPNAVGVILTGMGKDGAQGLLAMRQAGAATLGQDEASCVVYGMPGAARQMGAVGLEVPLERMGYHLLRALARMEEGQMAAG